MISWRLLLVGMVAYLVFLLLSLPAARAYAWLEGALAPLQLYGVEGRAINGKAGAVQWDDWRLDFVTWRWRPQALARGDLELALAIRDSRAQGNAVAGVDWRGTRYIRDLNIQLPVKALEDLWRTAPVRISGWLRVHLSHLRMAADGPHLRGVLTLDDVTLEGETPIPLGNFEVLLEDADGGVQGLIRDRGGPLQVGGVLHVDDDGTYRLSATLVAREGAPARVAQVIGLLGKPQADGKVAVSLAGKLPL